MVLLLAFMLPAAAQIDTRAPIRISDDSVPEGKPGETIQAVFTVQLDRPALSAVTVSYATRDASATVADNDYQPVSGDLRFEPGELSKTIEVSVKGDYEIEGYDEHFVVILSNPSPNAYLIHPEGKGTIQNDDSLPPIYVYDVQVAEGNSGVSLAEFTIALEHPFTRTATVEYETRDGTAKLADRDYERTSGVATFPPGATTFSVKVPVHGDTTPESDETFPLRLDNPQNARLYGDLLSDNCVGSVNTGSGPCRRRGGAIGTIADDDGGPGPGNLPLPPVPGPPSLEDGPGGVFLTHHSDSAAVGWAGVATNPAGAQNIVRRSVAYVTHEKLAPRILLVFTTDAGFPVSTPTIRAGIMASGFPPCPGSTAGIRTGNCHELAAVPRPSGEFPEPGMRDLRTVNFADYDAVVIPNRHGYTDAERQELIRRSDELVKYVNDGGGLIGFWDHDFGYWPDIKSKDGWSFIGHKVTPFGSAELGLTDADVNGNTTAGYFLEAGCYDPVDLNANGEIISIATRNRLPCGAPGPSAYASIFDGEVEEGDNGVSNLSLSVRLSAPLPTRVTVDFAVSDQTAKVGSDYLANHPDGAAATTGTVTFEPNDTHETINVPVAGDTVVEGNETFSVELSNAVNAGIALPLAIGKIVDDDTLPGITGGDEPLEEAASLVSDAGTNPAAVPATQPQTQSQSFEQVLGQANVPQVQAGLQAQGGVQGQHQLQEAAQLNAAQQVQSQLAHQRSHVAVKMQPAMAAEKQSERRPQVEAARSGSSEHLATALPRLAPPVALSAVAMFIALFTGHFSSNSYARGRAAHNLIRPTSDKRNVRHNRRRSR